MHKHFTVSSRWGFPLLAITNKPVLAWQGSTRHKFSRRDFVRGVAAATTLAATAALTGCTLPLGSGAASTEGSGSAEGTGTGSGITATKAGGTLQFASHFPYSLDPFYLQELAGLQIAAALYDPLVRYDYQTGELLKAAAESWQVSQGGTVFTFKLVSGARFHNGELVTAADFKYSWERILKPDPSGASSPNAPHIAMIEGAAELMAGETKHASGIRVIDPLTLEVTLAMPYYDFPVVLSFLPFAPVPLSGVADDLSTFSALPVGNGPFRITGRESWAASALKLDRFEDYHGEPALLSAIEFCFFESDSEQGEAAEPGDGGSAASEEIWTVAHRVADKRADDRVDSRPQTYEEKTYEGLIRDELDVAQVPLAQLDDARMHFGESTDGLTAMPGNQVLVGQEAYTQFLWVNFRQEPLANVNVRKALSYAINCETLCRELYADAALPASGIVPPGVEGFRDGAWPAASYSPSKARLALLRAAAADDVATRTITLVAHDTAFERKLFEMIKVDLEAVGFVTATKVVKTQDEYWDALEKNAALALTGWIIDYPLMENFIAPLFATFGNYNQLEYDNVQLDESIIAARAVAPQAVRVKAYQKADDILANDMPVIPLFFIKHALVCSDRVNDFTMPPDGIAPLTKPWVSW
jgi:peptide/nickel transport system substrate-binding protein/oligopeptide transport system substrate-binding protein